MIKLSASQELGSIALTKKILFFLIAALNGCVMIPYETPEAHIQIQNDLNITDENILGISETNWCNYYYGEIPDCRATQGLGVLTKNGLILSLYKSKKYQHAFTLSAADIRCTHTLVSENSPEIFYVFTDTQSFMLAPITPSGQMKIPMKQKIYAYLNSQGATKLTGTNVAFIEKTGDKNYSGSILMVGSTPVPYATSSDVYRIINPCQA